MPALAVGNALAEDLLRLAFRFFRQRPSRIACDSAGLGHKEYRWIGMPIAGLALTILLATLTKDWVNIF